jgi:RNA polymerase sigma factor (sigma-70 family)
MAALFRTSKTTEFDRLYQRHAASVYRYAYAVLGNHADAEDVTQQAFLNAYRAMEQGTKPRKAENWLLTITHNEVRRHWRNTHERAREVELDEQQLADPTPEHVDPSIADVVRALQQLPPIQRSALVMREFEGRSYAEIAQVLDVTQSALEALLFRARRSLAEALEDALTCAEAELALSRRLDGRLPRRERRRLKAHLRECALCARLEHVQRRQRSLLGGLSVIPVPASLYLVRGESAAAALGLGMGGGAAGGSVVLGGGTAAAGTGASGVAAGLVAKAAAATAAAAVAGGVGYGVGTGPEPATRADRTVEHSAAVAPTREVPRTGQRTTEARKGRSPGPRSGPARPANEQARAPRKTGKARPLPATPAPRARGLERAERAVIAHTRGHKQAASEVKAPRAKPNAAGQKAPRARTRPELGGIGRVDRTHLNPNASAPADAKARGKPNPSNAAEPASPTPAALREHEKKGDTERLTDRPR